MPWSNFANFFTKSIPNFFTKTIPAAFAKEKHYISVTEDFFATNEETLSLRTVQLLTNDKTTHGALRITGVSAIGQGEAKLTGNKISVDRGNSTDDKVSFFYDVEDWKGAKGRAKATVKFINTDVESYSSELEKGDDVLHAVKGKPVVFEQSELLQNDLGAETEKLKMINFVSETDGFDIQLKNGLVIVIPPANYSGEAIFRYKTSDDRGLEAIKKAYVTFHGEKMASMRMLRTSDADTASTAKKDIVISNSFNVDEDAMLVLSPLKLASDAVGLDLSTTRISDARVAGVNGSRDFEVSYSADGLKVRWTEQATEQTQGHYPSRIEVFYTLTDDSGKKLEKSFFVKKPTSEAVTVNKHTLVKDVVGFDPDSVKVQKFETDSMLDVKQDGVNLVLQGKHNFHGKTNFNYTLEDKDGQKIMAMANVAIKAVDDEPLAGSLTKTFKEGQNLTISVTELIKNSHDSDGDKLEIGEISNVKNGTAEIVRFPFARHNDHIQVKPESHKYIGEVTFDYTVRSVDNPTNASVPATVTVRIDNVNDAPVAKTSISNFFVTQGEYFKIDSQHKKSMAKKFDGSFKGYFDISKEFRDDDVDYKQSDDKLVYSLREAKKDKAPKGVTIDPDTGEIAGTLDKKIALQIVATDKAGKWAVSKPFTIYVDPPIEKPAFAGPSYDAAPVYEPLADTVTAAAAMRSAPAVPYFFEPIHAQDNTGQQLSYYNYNYDFGFGFF